MIKKILMIPKFRYIIQNALTLVSFIIFYILIGLPLIFSLLLSALLFTAMHFLLAPYDKEKEHFNKILSDGNEKIKKLQSYNSKVQNANTRHDVSEIINVAYNIIKLISTKSDDNNNFRSINLFLTYYLDSVDKILSSYIELSSQNYLNENNKKVILEAEKMIKVILKNFTEQFNKIVKDDMSDLSLKINELEAMFKMEELDHE